MFNYNNYRKLEALNLYTLEYWYTDDYGLHHHSTTFMGIAGFYNAMDCMKKAMKSFNRKLISCNVIKAYILC